MEPLIKLKDCTAAVALSILLVVPGGVLNAQDLDPVKLQAVGTWSNLSHWTNFEQPFWNDILPEASEGAITANARPMDELGLSGFELMRQLKLGVFDVIHTLAVYSSSDVALASGIDLAGVVRDRSSYQDLVEAYRPVLETEFSQAYNSKVLGLYSFSSYSIMCNLPEDAATDGLGIFKGLKVRSHSTPMGDFIEGLGGTAVTLPFGEVVPALQQGTVDCAVTGTLSAYQAKWWQVTNAYLDIPLGYSTVVVAANLDVWNELSPETQSFIQGQVALLENRVAADSLIEDALGVACYAAGPCEIGEPGNNVPITLSEQDIAEIDTIVSDVVLARFADRCGAECIDVWNGSVGEALGIVASAK